MALLRVALFTGGIIFGYSKRFSSNNFNSGGGGQQSYREFRWGCRLTFMVEPSVGNTQHTLSQWGGKHNAVVQSV